MRFSAVLRTIILLLLAILAVGAAYYFFVARDNLHAVVKDQVYRSAQLDQETLSEVIERHDIRSIINLRGNHPSKAWYKEERSTANKYGVKLYDIDLSAIGLPPVTDVVKLKRLLQNVDTPILVHCRGGADRTGMASALVLLLDDETSLETAWQQLSFKYYNFMPRSIGKLLLSQYQDWLANTKLTHSSNRFALWLENDYVDENGNLRFYIDQINHVMWKRGTQYEDGYKYIIDRDVSPELEISGWAFDIHNQRLVKGVDIYLGKQLLGSADYGYAYAGVAGYFRNDLYMDSGWMFRAPIHDLNAGCYDLFLEIKRLDATTWRSTPQARICLR